MSIEEARQILLSNIPIPLIEEISIKHALGRVTAENILSDRDLPPFDRVSMDGIAINSSMVKSDTFLRSEGIQAAGSPQLSIKDSKNCIEVMTGAILPKGLDTVIRYEDLSQSELGWKINIPIPKGKNVHLKGMDRKKNDILIPKGTVIKPTEISILATVGKTSLSVYSLPKVAVISTGDELVDIDEIPLSHQIRRSNSYMLAAFLNTKNIDNEIFHLNDDLSEMEKSISDILEKFDVLMLSGGVSKGKFDFLPTVFENVGIKKVFHKVDQRPGKPFWFGAKENKTVFAFPGNPVASVVCYLFYFLPWIDKYQNLEIKSLQSIKLSDDIHFKPSLSYFAQVKLAIVNNETFAVPHLGKGSGDLANLIDVDGFIILPNGKEIYKKGEYYDFLPL
jgi:molybdopterin molybdotransferase